MTSMANCSSALKVVWWSTVNPSNALTVDAIYFQTLSRIFLLKNSAVTKIRLFSDYADVVRFHRFTT